MISDHDSCLCEWDRLFLCEKKAIMSKEESVMVKKAALYELRLKRE
jgi:hypothetical protein